MLRAAVWSLAALLGAGLAGALAAPPGAQASGAPARVGRAVKTRRVAVPGAGTHDPAPAVARLGLKPLHPGAAPTTAAGGPDVWLHSSRLGVVIPVPRVYLVFWGRQWSNDPAGAARALRAFFAGLGGPLDAWGRVLSQYCEGEPAGSTSCSANSDAIVHPARTPLRGVWFDGDAPAPARASRAAIAAEAVLAARHFGNRTAAANLDAQYVVASPSGTHPDGFPAAGFCGWHAYQTSAVGPVSFTNLPYVPDLPRADCTSLRQPERLDGYFSTESHEYAEAVTDREPFLGWTRSGAEIADLCQSLDRREALRTGTFDVQGVWSNAARRCVTSAAADGVTGG